MRTVSNIVDWFRLEGRVSRGKYLRVGLGLMLLKYAVEALVLSAYSARFYTPLDFVNPLLEARTQFTTNAPNWLGIAWVVWTLPFIWIAVVMSVRRALDAGINPWLSFLILVPVINFVLMIYLAGAPTQSETLFSDELTHILRDEANSSQPSSKLHATLIGLSVGFIYFLLILLVSVYFFHSYGATLFFGTPLLAGATTAYSFNRVQEQPLGQTVLLALAAGCAFAIGLLLLGLEGLICVAMAIPILAPAAMLGAVVGRAIALQRQDSHAATDRGLAGCLIALPLLAGVEANQQKPVEYVVMSSLTIDAPIEKVWKNVISFPSIAKRPAWYFRWGVSCPLGARIEGNGVGAMRFCDFTTGSFVEPITAWEAPNRLGFDVAEQPDPMTELSPYRHIHPPHLDSSFRSTHGEFRLVDLGADRTRLEGRTWYQLELYPHAYWTLWTDWLLHRIHERVLYHIKALSESAS